MDLETAFGPRQWDATVAVLAEGEAEESDWPTYSDGEPDGLTFDEIGAEFGISHTRVRQIVLGALRKLRASPVVHELHGSAS